MYQNVWSAASANQVGTVTNNPAWTSTDPLCQGYTSCTYADAMFVKDNGFRPSNKYVPTTTFLGEANARGSVIETSSWRFPLSSSLRPVVGQWIDKVGRTTGWTRGKVEGTCEWQLLENSVIVCSSRVTASAVGSGDSGGPVFLPDSGGSGNHAMGILYGGGRFNKTNEEGIPYCDLRCHYYFSDVGAVNQQLSRTFAY